MILFKKSNNLHKWLENQREKGKSIGFVPTMGALHKGHLSLIHLTKQSADIVVCSIFVNPTQFNDKKDFEKYPITIEKDIIALSGTEIDVLFLPSVDEIYSPGSNHSEIYELGFIETVLEGSSRPGHFQGVCKVVRRLLSIVMPDIVYLGQKDYQQCMVIKKLVELMGLSGQIKIGIAPTLREKNGLAMSSRNMRLTEEEREKASIIHNTLNFIKGELRPGDLKLVKKRAMEKLQEAGFKVEYVDVANANSLQHVDNWNGSEKLVALVAAFLGNVRLIDNLVLTDN